MQKRPFYVTDDLLASKGQRLGNYFIDLLIQYGIAFGLGIAIVLYAEITGDYTASDYIESIGKIEEYLLGLVIAFGYYFGTEHFLSRSIGKFITKTIIVLEDGTKPDSMYILRRTACRLIPFEAFSFLGSPSRGWHDSISDTYVVDKARFDEQFENHNAFEQIGLSDETTPVIL